VSAPRLLSLLAVWLLATLGLRPLLLPDEGRYANVAREMLLQGDGLTPLLNGLPFFHKPPLMYWLDMAAMSVVGVNQFSARFGSAVGGFAMGAALFLATRRWHGQRAAEAALAVIATCPFFFVAAQYANLDMLVGGTITATVFAFMRALDDPKPALRWLLAAWALAALSVLAKGLIGFVLPALIIGPWLLVQGRWRELLRLLHPFGVLLFAAIALPWMLLMQHRYPGFFDYFIVEQHFRRYAQTNFNNVHPAWFFVVALPALTLPWSLWLPKAVADAWRARAGPQRARLALWAWWIVAVVAFFSLPSSKLVGYVLPALAPWCLLIGLAGEGRQRLARACFAVGAVASLALVLALANPRELLRLGINPQPSSKSTAAVLAAQMASADRIVYVDQMFSDLSYYAGLAHPVIIASDWASPDVPLRDNWRKELYDAARFDPARGRELLWPIDRMAELACHSSAVWFVTKTGQAEWLATLPGLLRGLAVRDLVLVR
jgi:4-amino-4-deoxy-L-arabinose transferase-like glycosyltransferase